MSGRKSAQCYLFTYLYMHPSARGKGLGVALGLECWQEACRLEDEGQVIIARYARSHVAASHAMISTFSYNLCDDNILTRTHSKWKWAARYR